MPTAVSTLLFANPAGTLLTHPAGYAIVRYQAVPLQVPDLHELMTHLGVALLHRGWYKVLADLRALPGLSEEVKEWARTYWATGLVPRPPVLVQATLLPTNAFARLAIVQMQQGPRGSAEIHNFADEAAARVHLLSLPATPAGR